MVRCVRQYANVQVLKRMACVSGGTFQLAAGCFDGDWKENRAQFQDVFSVLQMPVARLVSRSGDSTAKIRATVSRSNRTYHALRRKRRLHCPTWSPPVAIANANFPFSVPSFRFYDSAFCRMMSTAGTPRR